MENHCALIRRNASPHRTSLTGIWCLCAFLLLACFVEQAAAQPPQAEIDAAIKRGVAFLKKKPDYGRSGMNAFVAYTLLKTGESPDSPYIQNCLKNIMADHNQKNSDGEIVYTPGGDYNYTAGVQLMVFEAISPEKYHNEIKTTVDFLIKNGLVHAYDQK